MACFLCSGAMRRGERTRLSRKIINSLGHAAKLRRRFFGHPSRFCDTGDVDRQSLPQSTSMSAGSLKYANRTRKPCGRAGEQRPRSDGPSLATRQPLGPISHGPTRLTRAKKLHASPRQGGARDGSVGGQSFANGLYSLSNEQRVELDHSPVI